MKVLVAYDSKYGATEAIAERISNRLRAQGFTVDLMRAGAVENASEYEAFVIGSAVYYGSWMSDAAQFVVTYRAVLSQLPVWLFSSGPLGAETTDEKGRDVREAAEPNTLAEMKANIGPRDHRVFFGALDRHKLRLVDRLVAAMPAFPGTEGDFRDWEEIDAWADGIARALAPASAHAVGTEPRRSESPEIAPPA